MTRLLSKMGHSLLKRWRAIDFWLHSRNGCVQKEGKLWLNVPLRCDGVGLVVLGDGVSIGYVPAPMLGDGMVRLQARPRLARIEIGAGTAFSNNVQIIAEQRIKIGFRCLIGDGVLIMDSDFHNLTAEGRHDGPCLIDDVVIGDNVFLGSRAIIILKGVTIGRDTVIGAGSVVVSSIPSGVIAAGNPCRVIRPL